MSDIEAKFRVFRIKVDTMLDSLSARVSMLEIAAGLKHGDPHEEDEVTACRIAVEEARKSFNANNPMPPQAPSNFRREDND